VRDQQCLLVWGCAALLTLGCRKDKPSDPPTVRILQPGAGYSVAVPDTIAVSVSVSDDRLVERVTVLVADPNGVPLTPAVTASVQAGSATVALDLPVLDEAIATGSYVLTAIASDGQADARAFLGITVQAAPLRVRAMYLLPPVDGAGPYPVTRRDSAGGLALFTTLSELGGAALAGSTLFTHGALTGPLQRWDLGTAAGSVLVQNPGPGAGGQLYFNGLAADPADGRVYVGTSDGLVRGFAPNGPQLFNGATPAGFVSESTVVVGAFLVSAVVNPVTQQRALVQHGYASGAVFAQFPSAVDPVALFAIDDERLLLMGNAPAGAVIREVNVQLGGSSTVREFPGQVLRCAARASPDRFILALSTGVSRFDRAANAVVPLAPGLDANALAYDPVAGTVAAAVGATVQPLDPVSGMLGPSWTAPHPVGAILLQLNR